MGNAAEKCGEGNRLSVYVKNGTAMPTKPTGSTSTSSQAPLATGLPTGWKSDGCYKEGTTGRSLQHQQPDSQTNSVEVCVNLCKSQGYTVAGMEFGTKDPFLHVVMFHSVALSLGYSC